MLTGLIFQAITWSIGTDQISQRGGVAIYIKQNYNFISRDDLAVFDPGIFESVFIVIKSPNFNAIIGEIYRVPNTNELNTINMFDSIINKLAYYEKHIIIGSDLNFDFIKLNKNKNTGDLISLFLTNGLVPVID